MKLQSNWRMSGLGVLMGVIAASLSIALGFGFMVDDALITARVASQLWEHGAYRFNPTGPAVDCVTPLGFAWLMAPLAQGGVWSAFERMRGLGIVFHLLSGALLGGVIGARFEQPAAGRNWPSLSAAGACFTCLAACLPLGAWGSSGMETPFVTLLCSLALLIDGPPRTGALWSRLGIGVWSLSLAAALRPELAPFCFARVAFAPLQLRASATPSNDTAAITSDELGATMRRERRRQRALCVGAVALGPVLVASVRVLVFHHPAPLAIFAKPAGAADGAAYVLAAARLLGIPCLLLGWAAWQRVSAEVRACALACLVHAIAVLSAGGDWMPYFRLFVPIIPTLLWVGFELMQRGALWSNLGRWGVAFGFCGLLAWNSASARGVLGARRALSQQAEAYLRDAKVIGALDVGWVVASAPQAEIVDFAGITDERLAVLPGGHTSKRLPQNLLDARHIDTLVLLMQSGISAEDVARTSWQRIAFARTVEQRVRILTGAEEFQAVAVLPLKGTTQAYLVLRRNDSRFARLSLP